MVLAQKVDPAREQEYVRWQKGINEAASRFPGYQRAEMVRPTPGVQDEWVIVYGFETHEQLEAWLGSDERAAWLARSAELCFEPPTAHRLATQATERTVTVVASHRVKPGAEESYRRWQKGINQAASRFSGFVSTELFEPVAGEQDAWVVVFRFEDAARLGAWLGSDERAEWLRRADPFLERIAVHTVGGGLGGWFGGSEREAETTRAPPWKQSMAVLLALYPTVIALVLLLNPSLSTTPGSVATFVSNVVSVAILTWCLMPLVTRAFSWWLDPHASIRSTVVGALVMVGLYAALVAGFWAAGV